VSDAPFGSYAGASLESMGWFDPGLVDFPVTGTLYTITLTAASPNVAVAVKQARPVRVGTDPNVAVVVKSTSAIRSAASPNLARVLRETTFTRAAASSQHWPDHQAGARGACGKLRGGRPGHQAGRSDQVGSRLERRLDYTLAQRGA
jgi:hypothetical protein